MNELVYYLAKDFNDIYLRQLFWRASRNKPNLTEQGLILAPLGPVRRNSYADFDEVMT